MSYIEAIWASAKEEMIKTRMEYIGTEHALLAFVKDQGGRDLLWDRGVDPYFVEQKIGSMFSGAPGGCVPCVDVGFPMTMTCKSVVKFMHDAAAYRVKKQLPPVVKPHHLLVGLVQEPQGLAGNVLRSFGIDYNVALAVSHCRDDEEAGEISLGAFGDSTWRAVASDANLPGLATYVAKLKRTQTELVEVFRSELEEELRSTLTDVVDKPAAYGGDHAAEMIAVMTLRILSKVVQPQKARAGNSVIAAMNLFVWSIAPETPFVTLSSVAEGEVFKKRLKTFVDSFLSKLEREAYVPSSDRA